MSYEAAFSGHGYHAVWNEDVEVLRVPIVTLHEGVTVCEFRRLDASLSIERAVGLIRHELLAVFSDNGFRSEVLELVDLDRNRWTRVPYEAPFAQIRWIAVAEAWPPSIETRTTGLAGAPRRPGLELGWYLGDQRFPWTAASASPDGRRIVMAHGDHGVVESLERTDPGPTFAAAGRETLPPADARLLWIVAGARQTLARDANWRVHVHDGQRWRLHDVGGMQIFAAALSPDGTRVAFACADGHLRIHSWDTLEPLLDLSLDAKSIRDVRWSHDSDSVVVGHHAPAISVHSSLDGAARYRVEGTLPLQSHFAVGPDLAIGASLRTHSITIHRGGGELAAVLPNSAAYGLSSSGFARNGALFVSECNEGMVRVWRVADGQLLAMQPCAVGEPVLVLDQSIVLRNSETDQLEERLLPASQAEPVA